MSVKSNKYIVLFLKRCNNYNIFDFLKKNKTRFWNKKFALAGIM